MQDAAIPVAIIVEIRVEILAAQAHAPTVCGLESAANCLQQASPSIKKEPHKTNLFSPRQPIYALLSSNFCRWMLFVFDQLLSYN